MTVHPGSLFSLEGKRAVVTGASRGIGEAIARRFAEHGARVVVSSRKIDACEEVARSINTAEGREAATAIACNISDNIQIDGLIEETVARLGGVDILVCNAAVNPYFGPSAEMSEEQFDKILQCNVKANMRLAHLARPQMEAAGAGSIVIISSIGGMIGSSTLGGYAISKAADMQIARNLAVEFGPSGIRVNCIAPSVVKTYFAEALWKDPKIEKAMTEKLPLRRFGEPDDIAGAAVFLAAPSGAWMTGQTMVIDGGTLASGGFG